MLLIEIIKTCSHEKIAQAAVASIGSDFEQFVERAARERGMRTGSFVASTVRCFGHMAGDDEWAGLADAITGKDMPILSGLRHILEVTRIDQPASGRRSNSYARLAGRRVALAAADRLACEA
jgi:hypothetical protein